MKKLSFMTFSIILALFLGVGIQTCTNTLANPALISTPSLVATQTQYIDVNPLEIVAAPTRYLNKNIRIHAKFDKYSTLGLDYQPAMRSHEQYISFLIQRPDVTNHNIPLSELKIFLKKDIAEKNIDLDADDEIVFTGRVFSTALGDAWMDVEDFKVVKKANKTEIK